MSITCISSKDHLLTDLSKEAIFSMITKIENIFIINLKMEKKKKICHKPVTKMVSSREMAKAVIASKCFSIECTTSPDSIRITLTSLS